MKDVIKTILLATAIYSGTFTVNSHKYFNIPMAVICGIACSTFVIIKEEEIEL